MITDYITPEIAKYLFYGFLILIIVLAANRRRHGGGPY